MFERAQKLKVSIPDPSELWMAVWSMSKRVIMIDEVFMLQVTQARIITEVEIRPTEDKVLLLYNMILCEFELKVGVKTEARPGPDGAAEKKDPMKNAKGDDPKGEGKGKEKGESKDYTSWNDPAKKNLDGSQKNLTKHEKKEALSFHLKAKVKEKEIIKANIMRLNAIVGKKMMDAHMELHVYLYTDLRCRKMQYM